MEREGRRDKIAGSGLCLGRERGWEPRAGFKCVEALGRNIIIERPLPTLKCYNLHALTIVMITKSHGTDN